MDAKQVIKELRNILNIKLNDETAAAASTQTATQNASTTTTDVKLTEVLLTDGSTLTNKKDSDFSNGDAVEITVDGKTYSAVPDGDIQLPDGRTVTVVGGKITNITAPVAVDAKSEKEIAKLKAELELLKAEFKTVTVKLNEATEVKAKLEKVVDVLSKEPGANPVIRTQSVGVALSKEVPNFVDEDTFKAYLSIAKKK